MGGRRTKSECREMVLVKAAAGRLIELSILPAGSPDDESCQREAGREGAGGDLMLHHLPPFSPLRGLSDTPTGPQCAVPWRHGSRRTRLGHWTDGGSLVSGGH